MTRSRLILTVILGLFIVLQLIPLNQTNPVITETVSAPAPVMDQLQTSCFDCHSNETVWPWYSRLVPGSFLITRDVKEGRKHLNFSMFDDLMTHDSSHIAGKMIEVLKAGNMPLLPYLMLHPDASLSESQNRTLINWAQSLYSD